MSVQQNIFSVQQNFFTIHSKAFLIVASPEKNSAHMMGNDGESNEKASIGLPFFKKLPEINESIVSHYSTEIG